jgi:hypothetical protein
MRVCPSLQFYNAATRRPAQAVFSTGGAQAFLTFKQLKQLKLPCV